MSVSANGPPLLYQSRRGMTLIELLVVIIALAALIVLVLPGAGATSYEAMAIVRDHEMANIQTSFQKAYDDCVLTDAQLVDVAAHGVWPLFSATHPNGGTDCVNYDADKETGWRGPYASAEGHVDIDPASVGQLADGVGVSVLNDPFGGYYRVVMPTLGATRERRLVLVCTGADGLLQTTDVADADGEIVEAGDDTVLRLLPLAP